MKNTWQEQQDKEFDIEKLQEKAWKYDELNK